MYRLEHLFTWMRTEHNEIFKPHEQEDMKNRNIGLIVSLLLISQWGLSQLKVSSDGHVGIGTNNPVTRLHVYGEGLVDSHAGPWESAIRTRIHNKNTSAYSLWNGFYGKEVFFVNGEGWVWSRQGLYVGTDSSVMLKRSAIEKPLESVMKLHGIRFTYSDGKNNNSSNNYHLGLVSQEVEQVVPEAVKIMPDSLMSVSYSDLVPLLVEAMKEQQYQISELHMALNEQEEEIAKIKSRRWFRKKTE